MMAHYFHFDRQLDNVQLHEAINLLGDIDDCLMIDQVNWPAVSTHKPQACVRLAYSPQALFLLFSVSSDSVRATHTRPQSPVCQDSCVEFFMRLPDQTEYWNFEFNAIGTINASRRERRDHPTRLSEKELATIKCWSSLGTEPLDERMGNTQWSLAVRIPLLLLGIDPKNMPTMLYANFYKCGDMTSHPHYLSWARVHSDKPNFHRPEDFAPILFAEP